MKKSMITVALSFAATFAFLTLVASSGAGPAADSDGDGVQDGIDNCQDTANLDQYDSNLDGLGNICDADLSNDGAVGIPDFTAWLPAFPSSAGDANFNADADLTGDGAVGIPDFTAWLPAFPGPAATGRTSAPTVPSPTTCTGAGPC